MKTVSIKQLHEATGRCVRETRHGPLVVTDRGVKVAILKPFTENDQSGEPFPKRRVKDLPAVGMDSTTLISTERDAR